MLISKFNLIFWDSISNLILLYIPFISKLASTNCSFWEACSWNKSGKFKVLIILEFVFNKSLEVIIFKQWEENPPRDPSSTINKILWFLYRFNKRSSSIGFANLASATVISYPSDSSFFETSNAVSN